MDSKIIQSISLCKNSCHWSFTDGWLERLNFPVLVNKKCNICIKRIDRNCNFYPLYHTGHHKEHSESTQTANENCISVIFFFVSSWICIHLYAIVNGSNFFELLLVWRLSLNFDSPISCRRPFHWTCISQNMALYRVGASAALIPLILAFGISCLPTAEGRRICTNTGVGRLWKGTEFRRSRAGFQSPSYEQNYLDKLNIVYW